MKSSWWCVALVVGLTTLGGSAHARADWMGDEDLLPGVRLGLGPQFATDPNSRMLTGQFLLALDGRLDDNLGVSAELGYSGERRGRLAGRHLVIGGAVRFGSILGLSPLIHGMIGRTYGEPLSPTRRSGGLRVGGRVDVGRVGGVDIQYEARFIRGRDNENGFRLVFWFDALFALKAVGFD
jgi:hypothetical protein